MNTLFKLIVFGVMVICPTVLIAQNIEQIYMKSGSVVEGYIAEQKPGKHVTIKTTKATIMVDCDSLRNTIIDRVPVETLSKEWRQWAEENHKIIVDDSTEFLALATLEFDNSSYQNVYLLEKGSMIKFVDITPNMYTFELGDMYRTVKTPRPINLFSGLKEVLVLTDGSTIKGQIIEQHPGIDLKIAADNGEVISLKFSQISKIMTEKLSDDLDLWSQVQLLDRITIKGSSQPLTGFISSRTINKNVEFLFEDGTKRIIALNQITSYAKIPNDKYVALYDTLLENGEIRLNGNPAYFITLEQQDQYMLLGDIASMQLSVGESVCLEARLEDANTPITLVKAHIEKIAQKKGRKTVYVPWPVFTYQDLVQSQEYISRETTPLGNIKITFEVGEVGDYILYIQGREDYIIINVI